MECNKRIYSFLFASTDLLCSHSSDHYHSTLEIHTSNFQKGLENWKLDDSLWNEKILKFKINYEINQIIEIRAATPYITNRIKNRDKLN